MQSQGFAPIARVDARVLILGSLPGQESLRRREYYAQPRNAFWAIMGALFGARPELAYAARVRRLLTQRIAVWDVCAAAFRAGSLDASIVADSVVVNDFAAFFAAHRRIGLICFNGAKAYELYRRHVLPDLAGPSAGLPVAVLPSTSPAHAARSLADKLAAWGVARSGASRHAGRVAPRRRRAAR
jgi:double-stranded uracil-DNA glycosylase